MANDVRQGMNNVRTWIDSHGVKGAAIAVLAIAALLTLGIFGVQRAVTGHSGFADQRAAAYVNGKVITEGQATDLIERRRHVRGLDDDELWKAWLQDNGQTAEQVRSGALSDLVRNELVLQTAEEQGISVSDEEVNKAVEEARESFLDSWLGQVPYAEDDEGAASGDVAVITDEQKDEAWLDALAASGYDEQAYWTSTKQIMLENRLATQARQQGYDDWAEVYASDRDISYEEMPSGLPYNV